ncbi:MAG: minichromosome maintenance protein MCM, partial [Candidatus Thermoplasmatota archaeon]
PMTPPEAQPVSSLEADEPQTKSWERFFKKYYRKQINEAALGWPTRRSLVIDWFDLDKHDPTLAEKLLQQPIETLAQADEAIKLVDVPLEPRPRLHVRVEHLPDVARVDVRDIRAEHLGKLIAVKGLVKKTTEVRPKVQEAVFKCGRCGSLIREPQEEHLVLKEPLECYEDQGGCGRESTFKLIVGATKGATSMFVDTQKLEVQEAPEAMKGGEQPQRLELFAEDDLCGIVRPGERITVNGVLRSAVRKDHGVKSTLFNIFVDAVSVEKAEQEFEEIETTEEEELHIKRFSQDPTVYEKMRKSIAPNLYGLEMEKLALMLQLFGGVEKVLPDKSRLRGDIHVLLVGDPGVAKSQLIRYMSGLAPRGIYTSGKSSSGAGLTAAAVKDDFGEGRWTLEAGAMVLADRGLLCVDEIDKMDKNDQSSMHEGMEQQSISVAKAGITATLQSRCSVLGAANPKMGRFDDYTPIAEQINFPPALLSRFDIIFVMRDEPKVDRDSMLARHILNVHRGGAMLQQLKHDASAYSPEEVDAVLSSVEPALAQNLPKCFKDWKDFLRKYVAYSKRTCHPVLSDDSRDRLAEYFVGLRNRRTMPQLQGNAGAGRPAPRGGDEGSRAIPLTARQLEALVRISESSARVRLSRDVTAEDTRRAIEIYEYYMKRIGASEGGIIDADIVASGVSNAQRIIMGVIRELSAGTEYGADMNSVKAACESRSNVPPEKVDAFIAAAKQRGELYSPRDGFVKHT